MAAIDTGLNATASQAGFNVEATSIPNIVNRGIQAILVFLGVLLMLLFLYGGYQWMTAGGDSKKVSEAKDRIKNATIGLAIILAAYSLSAFVLDALIGATT